MESIAVIGAGSGGQLTAGHLASKGYRVNLYDINEDIIDGINKKNCVVTFEGALTGKGKLACASNDLQAVMADSKIVIVVTLTSSHADVAKALAGYLTKNHLVVLHPGGTFGALAFMAALKEEGAAELPVIAELQDLVYTCRSIEPGLSRVMGVKKDIAVGTIPAPEAERVAQRLCTIFPQLKPVPNTIYTSLGNLAPVTHPGPIVLNAAKIETQEKPFPYLDTITPSVALLMEKVDEERRSIAKVLGIDLISLKEWLQNSYGIAGDDIFECYKNADVYSELTAQSAVKTRYITEDVPCGLIPMIAIAAILGVKVPAMEALVTMCGVITNEQYEQNGRNMDRLGIRNINKEGLLSLLS
ncbi:MAG: NAD/NADP octopine/nopaline dehydrogenase family protein [Oscillospiraceae bacterium]